MSVEINWENITKILIIKFGGIGDVLLSTPVIFNIKTFLPKTKLFFLTEYKCRDVIRENPYLDGYFTFDLGVRRKPPLYREIKKHKFNLIIDLYCNPRSAFVVWYSRAPYRVGFSFRFRKYAYTHIINRRSSEVHNLNFNLDALKHIGIPILSRQTEIYLNFVHTEFADQFISNNNLTEENLLGILISGGWETKKFKLDGYKKLVKKILELYKIKIIIFQGNQAEESEARQLKSEFESDCYISPTANLKYTSALMKKCKAIIGNDSGLLHLAVASQVPVLGIYGPTDPRLQGPFGEKNLYVENDSLDCLHCNLQACNIGNICMTQLDINHIVSKFKELLKINNISLEEKDSHS